MDCATGGFRALRCHVKAVKGGLRPCAASSGGINDDERSESPRDLQELTILDVGEAPQQCNQDKLREREKQLDALRAVVMKEHQNLQSRERSIRLMEHTLEDELQRVAEKERDLDSRILEITRLEARLHEALEQQPQNDKVETIAMNNGLDDREAILDLREKKLAFSKAHMKEREKHLQVKERVLTEKESELASFQAKLERKYQDAEARQKLTKDELHAAHIQQMTSMKAYELELEARRVHLEGKEASITS